MTKFTIDVTQDDIDYGVKCDAMHCPVANAMKRHWPMPAVGSEACFPAGRPAKLPKAAQRFTRRFDAGEAVKPFKFTLEV